jgi:hypothetical protein
LILEVLAKVARAAKTLDPRREVGSSSLTSQFISGASVTILGPDSVPDHSKSLLSPRRGVSADALGP